MSYFVATLILARIIGPKDFGIVGIIAVFLGVGMTFVDSGLSTSLIRSKGVEADYSTIFISNLGLSLVVYAISFFIAPLAASFYELPVLEPLIKVYCLGFVLIAMRMVHQVVLIKALEFRRITILNIPGNVVGLVVSVILAQEGYGVWSLIALYLSSQLITTLIYWSFLTWRPNFHFSLDAFKRHFSFGYKLMISTVINTVFDNIYNLVIGKSYSIQTLSYYERAYTLNNYPISTISGIISKISLPLLTQVSHEPDSLFKAYQKSLIITFFVTCPLMLGALAVADPLVTFLLGEEWRPSVQMFQILCLAYMLYPVHSLNINLLTLFGRSDLFLKLEIIKKLIVSLLLVVGFYFGIYGLIWSNVVGSLLGIFLNSYYVDRLLGYGAIKQIRDMMPTFLISVAMSAVVYFSCLILDGCGYLFQLLFSVIIGVSFFYFTAKLTSNQALIHILSLFK